MNATNVQYLRSNEVNDIFSYINSDNEIDYAYYPKTMFMTVEDVKSFLND